jgi:hypothetical protein
MELEIRFTPSAFKHGWTEADIRLAIATYCHDDLQEGSEDVYLLIGFDASGNHLLEILYKEVGENGMLVFHAMECRKKYYCYIPEGL